MRCRGELHKARPACHATTSDEELLEPPARSDNAFLDTFMSFPAGAVPPRRRLLPQGHRRRPPAPATYASA